MSMFDHKRTWYMSSKTDPKWNASGHSDYVGGFDIPIDCKNKIEFLKKSMGEPPEDLIWGYMKD